MCGEHCCIFGCVVETLEDDESPGDGRFVLGMGL
jgi:hypothetical protein